MQETSLPKQKQEHLIAPATPSALQRHVPPSFRWLLVKLAGVTVKQPKKPLPSLVKHLLPKQTVSPIYGFPQPVEAVLPLKILDHRTPAAILPAVVSASLRSVMVLLEPQR